MFAYCGVAPLQVAVLNKHSIVGKIIATLAASREIYTHSAREAHAGATHEQNKAENKYDTRGLEAGYLARGQSRQAAEVALAMQRYESLPLRQFGAQEPIDIGAVVELERDGEHTFYFIGPLAGGIEVDCEGQSVQVITPQSPMGQQLVGHKQDECLSIRFGGTSGSFRIVAVI